MCACCVFCHHSMYTGCVHLPVCVVWPGIDRSGLYGWLSNELGLLALSGHSPSPAPLGLSRPGESAGELGAAHPECVQEGAAEGAREEPGQGGTLCQGPAAVPTQPGGGWGACSGTHTPPFCQTQSLRWTSALPRIPVTATWSCSLPTSTSRLTVLQDSHSR